MRVFSGAHPNNCSNELCNNLLLCSPPPEGGQMKEQGCCFLPPVWVLAAVICPVEIQVKNQFWNALQSKLLMCSGDSEWLAIVITLSSSLQSVPGHTHSSSCAAGGFYCSDINELERVRSEECTELERVDRIKQTFFPLDNSLLC